MRFDTDRYKVPLNTATMGLVRCNENICPIPTVLKDLVDVLQSPSITSYNTHVLETDK